MEAPLLGSAPSPPHSRNPWGNFEWQGKWSDTSDAWDQECNKQVKKLLHFKAEDDGAFWMELDDFVKCVGRGGGWNRQRTTAARCLTIILIPPARSDDDAIAPSRISSSRYRHTVTITRRYFDAVDVCDREVGIQVSRGAAGSHCTLVHPRHTTSHLATGADARHARGPRLDRPRPRMRARLRVLLVLLPR